MAFDLPCCAVNQLPDDVFLHFHRSVGQPEKTPLTIITIITKRIKKESSPPEKLKMAVFVILGELELAIKQRQTMVRVMKMMRIGQMS